LASSFTALLASVANDLVRALKLSSFPVSSFLWFLLLAVIATQIVGFIRREIVAGEIFQHLRTGMDYVPIGLRQRLVFITLIICSFYLGLSALLAIPLFQDKSKADLTPETLIKSLDSNIVLANVFDQRFPAPTTSLDVEAPNSENNREENTFGLIFFQIMKGNKERHITELKRDWDAAKSVAVNDPTSLRDQARNVFAAGIDVSPGRKQTARHYSDLIRWHQVVTRQAYDRVSHCGIATNNYVVAVRDSLARLRSRAASIDPQSPSRQLVELLSTEQRDDSELFSPALEACQMEEKISASNIPERPSFSDTLGPVGTWTRWLLDTEQMPVVIIVGLVGFSLLGATVSRAVRLGPDQPRAAMTLDDLLIVIAGGTTAAMVVFLASYGGLALLGTSGGDPNPYVVFVTCLIGAVYSEDVWAWARTSLLKKTKSDTAKDQSEDGVVQSPQSQGLSLVSPGKEQPAE
jgi:hypothetical protein